MRLLVILRHLMCRVFWREAVTSVIESNSPIESCMSESFPISEVNSIATISMNTRYI